MEAGCYYEFKGPNTIETSFLISDNLYKCIEVNDKNFGLMDLEGIIHYIPICDKKDFIKSDVPSNEFEESCIWEEAKRRRLERDKRIDNPPHYKWLKDKCNIEVIDLVRHLDFCTGNAIKYLLRAGYKNEEGYTKKQKTIEDLKKAIWYINDRIKTLEK